jgi:hypothetical protein
MITVPPGEFDGATRCCGGPSDRLAQLHAFGELAAVAGHYEQGVIDPYPQTDHRCQSRRGRRHIHFVAEQSDDAHPGDQPQDRGNDRKPHRNGSAEGEQEDLYRGRQPDDLGEVSRRLGDLLAQVTARSRAQASLLKRPADVDDSMRLVEANLRRTILEVEGDVAYRLPLVELVTALLANRTRGLSNRRILGVGFGDPLDRLPVARIGELGAGWSPEHDRHQTVGLFRKPVAEQVAGLMTTGTRQCEVVACLLASIAGHTRDQDDYRQPNQKDGYRMASTEATQEIERSS